jgi:hypothetical protein
LGVYDQAGRYVIKCQPSVFFTWRAPPLWRAWKFLGWQDHPHIAQVLDAGTTDAGRPYFIMELIRGIPITAFGDENRLKPRERLELFLAVCQAVQHAHQKRIIHRDLKPSNVLVTLLDGTPTVKVIDFGIAKALGQAAITVSVNRKSEPKRLSQLFRGELDWIIMKALEKDRDRRSDAASSFATDLALRCMPSLTTAPRTTGRTSAARLWVASVCHWAFSARGAANRLCGCWCG